MLRKLGWWAVGVALAFVGVIIFMLIIALLVAAFSPERVHMALIVLATVVGFIMSCAILAVPGYVAARFGGGGALMGLAVGLASAVVAIGVGVVVKMVGTMDLAPADRPSLVGGIVAEAVILIVPPIIGGW
jgi:hypothetical protein